MRSLVSSTRRQVMVSGSISRRAKRLRSSGVSSLGSVFEMPSLRSRRSITGENLRLPSFAGGHRRSNIWSSSALCFVKHARIDGGGQQIIRRDDGVNVAGEMEIELLHRNDLAVAAAGRAALDAERGALAGLANAGEHFLAQVRAQRLAEADGGGGLALAQRRGRDRGHHDVFSVGRILQPVANGEVHFGFGLAVEVQFFGKDTGLGGDLVDGKGRGGLRDFDIAGHTRQDVR